VSLQKNIGTAFEYRIAKMINEMGEGTDFKAKRIWYSGTGLRKPYDVELRKGRKLVMSIEAKRSVRGSSISLELGWLRQVTVSHIEKKRHVMVIACGNYSGREVPCYVISQLFGPYAGDRVIVAKPGKKSVSVNKKWIDEPGKDPFYISANGRFYEVKDFKRYFERDMNVRKEAP
jgi:hypothetical protein